MSTVRDCDYPWTGFMIWSNGSACCCCYGSTPVGDVSKASPESVWNNPTMQSLRASLSAGVVHTVCQSGTCKYVVGSRASEPPSPEFAPAPGDFDEAWYLARYHDVALGVGKGLWSSGLDHYRRHGHREFRCTNGREWKRSLREQREKASSNSSGYRATLSWLRPARVHRDTIVMNFSAANSGSITWQPKGQTPIRAAADSYRRLEDVHRTRPMYGYRVDLPGSVEPGRSVSLEIRAPLDHVPIGRSFLIVDLVCDEKEVKFTSGVTKPLVLGVHRDELSDQVNLAMSETDVVI
jgi:iron-sulfur cluster protein